MVNLIIGYGDAYMPLIALIIFLFVKKSIRPEEQSFIYFLVANTVLLFIINIIPYFGYHNLFLYPFYYLFDLIFVTYYVTKHLLKLFNPLFYIIATVYFLFWLTDIFVWEGTDSFISNAAALEKIIIFFLCMYYIITLAKTDDLLKFKKLPGFWIASGFLISSAMGIFAVVAYKYYIQYNLTESGNNVWLFDSIGTVLKFTLIITGFLCYKRNPRLPYQSPTLL